MKGFIGPLLGQKALEDTIPGLEGKIPGSRTSCLEGGLCCLTQSFTWFRKGTNSTDRGPKGQRHAQVVGVTPPVLGRFDAVRVVDGLLERREKEEPRDTDPSVWASAGSDR